MQTCLPIDHNQFSEIKTKEIAYILGFLWADGYLETKSYSVRLEVNLDDFVELEKTFDSIGLWRKFFRKQRNNDKPTGTFTTGNKKISEILLDYGYKDKSKISACKILSKIPSHLHEYWWRGFFEGDGNIHVGEQGAYTITIAGAHAQDWTFLFKFLDSLSIKYKYKTLSKINKKSNKLNSSSYITCYNKCGFQKFLGYIYKNRDSDGIGLTRKYNKYLLGLSQILQNEKIPIKGMKPVTLTDLSNNISVEFRGISDALRSINFPIRKGLNLLYKDRLIENRWKITKNRSVESLSPSPRP